MTLTLLKIILTPLLIASATLAARRWGAIVGGWIVGLPLMSGPISVFLALEQGRVFAAAAARSSILASTAILAYCVVYTRVSGRHGWPVSVIAALGAYFAAVFLFSRMDLAVLPATLFAAAAVPSALFLAGPEPAPVVPPLAPRWDLPFRMIATTLLVVCITALSTSLGPQLSGLISSFPASVSVMAIFSHAVCGPMAAKQFLRGVIIGSFSFIAFFLAVALTVPAWPLFFVYCGACFAAGCTNCAAFGLIIRRKKAGRSC